MKEIFQNILDWSEVWALLIPLAVLIVKKNNTPYLKPVRWFIYVALIMNAAIDLVWRFKQSMGIQEGDFLWSNNFIYNALSIIRLLLFAWFFNLLQQRFLHRVKRILPFLFLAFAAINFIFYEDFFNQKSFSSRLLATEAGILLFYCLQYFIYLIVEEKTVKIGRQPGFWIISGLSIYVAVNFFIFLFYATLSENSSDAAKMFAVNLWDVHNIVFILFCTLMAIQFARKND